MNILSPSITSVTLDEWTITNVSISNAFVLVYLNESLVIADLSITNLVINGSSVIEESTAFQVFAQIDNTLKIDGVTIKDSVLNSSSSSVFFDFTGKCTDLIVENVILDTLTSDSLIFISIKYNDYSSITL